MSAELSGQVWKLKLSHGQQVVMLALADHAHDDGTHCYPGVPYLAWKTGYTERNVRRILGELEAAEIIEPQEEKRGGAGNVTEYHIHLEKGDKKDEYNPDKPRKRVTTRTQKGDKPAQNPDKSAQKGDNSPRANTDEPSGNHQEPSWEGAPLPDDTTSRCLFVLKKVKGIGKNPGELALLLAELRAEYPQANPVQVCKDYEFNHRVGKEKTKIHAAKLRSYFRTASTPKRNGKPPPASLEDPKEARRKREAERSRQMREVFGRG